MIVFGCQWGCNDKMMKKIKLAMIVLCMPTVDSEELSADELLFEGNVYKCTQFNT